MKNKVITNTCFEECVLRLIINLNGFSFAIKWIE